MIKKVIPGKNLSKLRISTVIYVTYSFIACYRACMHIRYVRFVHQPSGAGPRLSILLAAPRGAADVYVSLCMFWSYLTTFADNAPFNQRHLCHPFIYGLWSSCLPLAVSYYTRTIITKCSLYPRVKSVLAPQHTTQHRALHPVSSTQESPVQAPPVWVWSIIAPS